MKSLLANMQKEGGSYIYSLDKMSLWFLMCLGIVVGVDVWNLIDDYGHFSDKNRVNILIECCVLLMVTIFSLTYSFLIRCKLINNEVEKIKQEDINKSLLEVNDELKCFKHDFYNILQAINGYLYLNDMIGLKNYYDKLLTEVNDIEFIEIIAKKLKNNPAIFGVLLDKFKKAKESGVEVLVESDYTLQKLGVKNYNVSRILGVLIDNAIEAARECENKVVSIRFIKEDSKKQECIEVKNTYNKEDDLDMKKIYDKHYTSKNNGKNQGLGLWKVGKIVRKNDDFNIFTTIEEDVFIQNLKICV